MKIILVPDPPGHYVRFEHTARNQVWIPTPTQHNLKTAIYILLQKETESLAHLDILPEHITLPYDATDLLALLELLR